MEKKKFTRRQREIMRPFADMWRELHNAVQEIDDESLLSELIEACESVTTTNCGWDIYGAAPTVEDSARRQLYHLRLVRTQNPIED